MDEVGRFDGHFTLGLIVLGLISLGLLNRLWEIAMDEVVRFDGHWVDFNHPESSNEKGHFSDFFEPGKHLSQGFHDARVQHALEAGGKEAGKYQVGDSELITNEPVPVRQVLVDC